MFAQQPVLSTRAGGQSTSRVQHSPAPAFRNNSPLKALNAPKRSKLGRKQAQAGAALPYRVGIPVMAAAAPAQDVHVEEISNENAHISLKVTVSDARCRKAWDEVLRDAQQRAEVPGYRKGAKVPQSILIGFLGGKEEVAKIACERVMRDSIAQALSGVADKAIADSERIESAPEELMKNFGPDRPFVYQVGVDLPASIEFTSDYK